MAQLLDHDSYGLTIEEISHLTVRQIYFLYYADRDKEGRRKDLPYYFKTKEDKLKERIALLVSMGQSMGKTQDEIKAMVEKAKKNGSL